MLYYTYLYIGGALPGARGGCRWLVVPPGVGGVPPAYLQAVTLAGTRKAHLYGGALHRNPRFQGIKTKGYCSIYQLFKFSFRAALCKSFMEGNLIKTLFSIDYRGYFIIQAVHSTINYSYFSHKTDRKTCKNQKNSIKASQNERKTTNNLVY